MRLVVPVGITSGQYQLAMHLGAWVTDVQTNTQPQPLEPARRIAHTWCMSGCGLCLAASAAMHHALLSLRCSVVARHAMLCVLSVFRLCWTDQPALLFVRCCCSNGTVWRLELERQLALTVSLLAAAPANTCVGP